MNGNHAQFNAPTILIILGATGDLMKRKLAPAIFHLHRRGQLPNMFRTVGFGRRAFSDGDFKAMVGTFVNGATRKEFLDLFTYCRGDLQDEKGYASLAQTLKQIDDAWGVCSNKLFYLAVPPKFYEKIFYHLAELKLTEPCSDETGWTRVLVEKPFGQDLATAERLDQLLGKLFKEKQVFRIDHYLAKEAVQNILALRFSNSIFESSWDKETVEKIEIKILEDIGVEGRGEFYDGVGALRDVGQNHILQMLALIAMERPQSFTADDIRGARAALLKRLSATVCGDLQECSVRGQYAGYHKEPGVHPDSETETYFKLTLFVENDRWRGVPIVLESGKRLNRSAVEIIITFRHAEPCLCPPGQHFRNALYFQLQPDQEISVSLFAKRPGPLMRLEEKALVFNHGLAFGGAELFDAYEKILLDCIAGDQTLFASTEEVMASWRFIDTIIGGWKAQEVPLKIYEPGSAGLA